MNATHTLDETRYAEILARSPAATFFHTRTWARILAASFPALEDHSYVTEVDGQAHAIPLFRWVRLRGLLRTWHSSFPFLYGGPIPPAPAAWERMLAHVAAGDDSVFVLGNPFAVSAGQGASLEEGSPVPPGPGAGRLLRGDEITHLVVLPGSIDQYWSEVLTTRKRNDIRRLSRKGVVVELTGEADAVAQVYALYRQRMAGWAQRPGIIYPQAFYEAMLALGGGAVRLYVARYGQRTIGGAFVVRWNGITHYNAGYFDDDARALRPNVLIQERIIRDAIEDRCHTYDMLPSAGLASVETFKESFGGVRTPVPRWEQTGRWHRWLRRLRRHPSQTTGGNDEL